MKYKTKPVEIEAVKWTGQNVNEVVEFAQGGTRKILFQEDGMFIETLEGKMKADEGDYIIRGLKGEYYPCKPDIFEMKYSPTPHTGE